MILVIVTVSGVPIFKPEDEKDSTAESVSSVFNLKQRQLHGITMGRIMAQPQSYKGFHFLAIVL